MQNQMEKKWAAYAGAAAAVVGASGAHGAIIAQSLNTPFNTNVLSAPMDFNNDGVVDYELLRGGNGGATTDYVDLKQGLNAGLGSTNRFVLDVPSNRIASLAAGTTIGPASPLDSNFDGVTGAGGSVSLYDERKQGNGQPGPSGNFRPDDIVGNPEYVGVRFKIGGAGIDYYGWIAVDFTSLADVAGVVTGIAYEDTGAAINAGDVGGPSVVKGDFGGGESTDGSFNTPDASFNELDVEGFLLALNNQASYLVLNPSLGSSLVGRGDFGGNESTNGSFNTPDGAFNELDVEGFLLALNDPAGYAAIQPPGIGGVSAIPEPSGLAALALGAAVLIRRKGR